MMKQYRWMGAIYAIAFALLYLLVFLLFPPSAALHVLQTCRTSAQSFIVNFATAPVSYFEIWNYILLQERLLKHAILYGAKLQLIILNFIVVQLLIFGTFAYFHTKRKTHAFNAHKVFWSGIFATYMFMAIVSLLNSCGTGTSIMGVSLTSILLVCVGYDLFYSAYKGAKLTSSILQILALLFLVVMMFSYLLSPVIHLSGLALFILILYVWDRQFRKELTKVFSYVVKRISAIGLKHDIS
jgi:hypothetical protein